MPAHARLRRVAGHLDATATATATATAAATAAAAVVSRRVIAEPADLGAGLLPLQLAPGLDASGRLQPLPESLDRLRQAMHAAAAAGDFRLATALQDVLFVAEPTAPLTVEACAPESPEECWDFFVENGFVCVRDLFGPEQLARIQAAWRRVQGPARALWQLRLAASRFFCAARCFASFWSFLSAWSSAKSMVDSRLLRCQRSQRGPNRAGGLQVG